LPGFPSPEKRILNKNFLRSEAMDNFVFKRTNTKKVAANHRQLTADNLAKEYPDVYAELVAKAKGRIYSENRDAGFKKGAEEERERIQSILALSIPGQEALVKELAFDGKTTRPEAATRILESIPIADHCHVDWKRDANLRAEFTSVESFIAYKEAVAAGRA
jgi:hypothetical protein